MNWTIEFTEGFARGAKILKKRYKSFKHDLEDFKDSIAKNPFQSGSREHRENGTSSKGSPVLRLVYKA